MKLLYISHGNIPSRFAHSIQMMKMAEAFSTLTDDVRIVTRAHWSRLWHRRFDYESWYGLKRRVNVVHLYGRGRKNAGPVFDYVHFPGFDRRAARYAGKINAEIVYTRNLGAARLCIDSGIRTIVESHAGEKDNLNPLLAIKDHRNLVGIVTISDVLRDCYKSKGIREDKICVWPDAVDLNDFLSVRDRSEVRNMLGIPQAQFTATYCGHLYADRGIEDILVAAESLPDVRFLFVGGMAEDVAKRRQESQHLRNVLFTGFLENKLVPSILSASDIVLMPYSGNCSTASHMSPMKLFEGMASGRPVIASDLPILHEHLEHDRNCVFVEADSPSGMMDAIKRIRDNPKFAEAIGTSARQDVSSFTWAKRAECILDRFAGQSNQHPNAGVTPANKALC